METCKLVFGRIVDLPTSVSKVPKRRDYFAYLRELQQILENLSKIAKENQLNAKMKRKERYDQKLNVFIPKIGDLILVKKRCREKIG